HSEFEKTLPIQLRTRVDLRDLTQRARYQPFQREGTLKRTIRQSRVHQKKRNATIRRLPNVLRPEFRFGADRDIRIDPSPNPPAKRPEIQWKIRNPHRQRAILLLRQGVARAGGDREVNLDPPVVCQLPQQRLDRQHLAKAHRLDPHSLFALRFRRHRKSNSESRPETFAVAPAFSDMEQVPRHAQQSKRGEKQPVYPNKHRRLQNPTPPPKASCLLRW